MIFCVMFILVLIELFPSAIYVCVSSSYEFIFLFVKKKMGSVKYDLSYTIDE